MELVAVAIAAAYLLAFTAGAIGVLLHSADGHNFDSRAVEGINPAREGGGDR